MSDGMTEARRMSDDVRAMPDKQDLRMRLTDVAVRIAGIIEFDGAYRDVMAAILKLEE